MALRHRSTSFCAIHRWRKISTSIAASRTKVPTLYPSSDATTGSDDGDASLVQLFSWGRGASGQLGGGDGKETHQLYPSPIASLFLPPKFRLSSPISGRLAEVEQVGMDVGVGIGISCGLFHSGLIVDGELWVWGKGDGGRLGLGHEDLVFRPTWNPSLKSVRSISLGGLHSVALNSLGQVFTWGYGGFGALGHSVYTRELIPKLVQSLSDEQIHHIATSGTHTAAITEAGELYIWGRDEGEGRLGLGPGRGPDQAGGLSIPSKVKALPVPVAAVSCGGFFTTALTKDGQLWNWGANSNYELGRGNRVGSWKPQPIPSLEAVRVIQIASGGYHSLALTDEGQVFSWGYGGRGQLGHSSIQNQPIPLVIDALAAERIIFIACGGTSSAAITDEGKLYMWGNAKDYQLGVPDLPDVQVCPVEVKFPMEDDQLGSHNVLSVSIGASHAICLVSRTCQAG